MSAPPTSPHASGQASAPITVREVGHALGGHTVMQDPREGHGSLIRKCPQASLPPSPASSPPPQSRLLKPPAQSVKAWGHSSLEATENLQWSSQGPRPEVLSW